MKQGVAALVGLLLLPAAGHAGSVFEHPAQTIQLGVSALHFRYKEVDDDGSMLDREDGNLPGVYAAARVERDKAIVMATLSYHWGTVKYDGHVIETMERHQTDTDEAIAEATLTFGHYLGESRRTALYLGGGYRHWQRNIRSRGNVGGINELYTWAYGILGGSLRLWRGSDVLLAMDARATYPISPKLRIHWPGNQGYLTLQLPSRTGYRIAFPLEVALNPRVTLAVAPYYEYWKLPKSDAVLIGDATDYYAVWEPESTTKNVGVTLSLGF